jgi:4-alpha-glucanotransferase
MMSADLYERRRAGVLLHPTSLPGAARVGALGANARRYLETISDAGFTVWQMLPVGPVTADPSPYFARSNHAGNAALIDLEALASAGWIELDAARAGEGDAGYHARKLVEARAGFRRRASELEKAELTEFRRHNSRWLGPYALYEALKLEHGGKSWAHWPEPLRNRERAALEAAGKRNRAAIEQTVFEQSIFSLQWSALRRQANERGVRLFGDLPIYVAHDSVETWLHRRNFRLDAQGLPTAVAGVPPDYFAADGQIWGNPLYDWDFMRTDRFRWWVARVEAQLERFDWVRIDHFRGLDAGWSVPVGASTARDGSWLPAPGRELLKRLKGVLGGMPLVAEDLGIITAPVVALREEFDLPGMKILQFGFDGSPENPYLPHNHKRSTIVYTGTHDNDTTLGWYRSLDERTRAHVDNYFRCRGEDMPEALIRAALGSVAVLAVVPMQDLLALGSEARMNTPGTSNGNWRWTFDWPELGSDFGARWRGLNRLFARAA